MSSEVERLPIGAHLWCNHAGGDPPLGFEPPRGLPDVGGASGADVGEALGVALGSAEVDGDVSGTPFGGATIPFDVPRSALAALAEVSWASEGWLDPTFTAIQIPITRTRAPHNESEITVAAGLARAVGQSATTSEASRSG